MLTNKRTRRLPRLKPVEVTPSADKSANLLTVGHARVGLWTDGDRFAGLAGIELGGIPLRADRRPAFVEARTPGGVRMTHARLLHKRAEGDGVSLILKPFLSRDAGLPMDWMLHETRPRVATSDWAAPAPAAADPATRLTLSLRPAAARLGDWAALGLEYQYRWQSASHAIYKLLDRATWEPGGVAVGAEVWMRAMVPALAQIQSIEQAYSTEWYLPSAGNPDIYQFFPLQTHLQGFTFTVTDAGVLITWATRPAHVRTLLQKPAGVNEIEHWHEHCGDLAHDFETAPMQVLFVPGPLDRVACINLYEATREHISHTLHEQVGLRRERVTSFGFIEQWDRADLDHYTRQGLPKLIDAGVQTVGLANHFRNNMNVLGVGNMCCTLDLKVANSVGEDRLRAFCAKAEASGIGVEMWGNTALSSLAMLLDRNGASADEGDEVSGAYRQLKHAKDPFVRGPQGAIDADHYAPSFLVLNLRDPAVRRWWLQRWAEAYDRIGLRGIFLDSSFNLSSDKFHWRANPEPSPRAAATIDQAGVFGHPRPPGGSAAAIESQYLAHLELVRKMQALGYRYSAEDCGVFGVSRCGPGVTARLDHLFIWPDAIAQFDPEAIAESGHDPDAVFFKGLAYRLMWMICWDPKRDRLSFRQSGWRSSADSPAEHHLSLLRAYNRVEAQMQQRTVLPDESAVMYHGPDADVLWAFDAVPIALGEAAAVLDVLADTPLRTATLHAEPGRVYLIERHRHGDSMTHASQAPVSSA